MRLNLFEAPEAEGVQVFHVGGTGGKLGTRWKFPQVSPDLRVRWCSAYLKIDIADRAIRAQERFNNSKTLFITGERADESPNRAKYKEFEPHRADGRNGRKARHVDHWRPIKSWSESEVWAIIRAWKLNPHPAYKLGWGRVSCAACIFGSADQWASLVAVGPQQFSEIAFYEALFGVTIQRKLNVEELAAKGQAYPSITPELIAEAKDRNWNRPIFIEDWQLPAGAFGEQVGPT